MRNRFASLVLFAGLALAVVPACRPADAATATRSSPPGSSGGGTPVGWEAERCAVALNRITTLNRCTGTDLDDGGYFLGGGVQAPTASTLKSGGVFNLAAAGTGWIDIGKTDSQDLLISPKAESWYVAARVRVPSAVVFTAAKFTVPIGLSATDGSLYVEGIAAQSTTVFQINQFISSADHFTTLGSVATLGTAKAPVGSFFVVAMYFNVTTAVLTVEFSDTLAASFSGSGITNMITGRSSILSYGNDTTLGLQVDALFYAHVAP